MSLLGKLTGWLKTDRENLASFSLGVSKSDTAFDERAIVSGQDYFRVVLVHMYLRDKNRFLKSWFPAAHAVVEYSFGDETVEIPTIADTSSLFQAQAGTGEVVARNFHLTPLLPFNGGSISILAGLFAMEGEDYLKNTISVMSGFSKLLAVPQLSQVLHVAQPLADGLSIIFGAEDGKMHLGYHNRFVGSEHPDGSGIGNFLTQGYLVVIKTPGSDLDQSAFWVKDDTLVFGPDIASAVDFTDHDHMLLKVEFRKEKDDWDSLSVIRNPWQKAISALGENNVDVAKAHMSACMTAALQSADLTREDRLRVLGRLKAKFVEMRQALSFDVGGSRSLEPVERSRGADSAIDDDLSLNVLMVDAPSVPSHHGSDAEALQDYLKDL